MCLFRLSLCVEKGAETLSVHLCMLQGVSVCKAPSLGLKVLCLCVWGQCLLSKCLGLPAFPTILIVSRTLEKKGWALDCVVKQILKGRGMCQAIPSKRIQGNYPPVSPNPIPLSPWELVHCLVLIEQRYLCRCVRVSVVPRARVNDVNR